MIDLDPRQNESLSAIPSPELVEKVSALNARFKHHSATAVMEATLSGIAGERGKFALVSSFGAESVVLLHLAALADKMTPVLFVDTEMLFTETLVYQQEVTERLGLRNVQVIKAKDIAEKDPYGALRFSDTDACCALRKTLPLQHALNGFEGWITGRKRFQSGTRAALDFFEIEDGTGRIKVNPLAHWAPEDVRAYMEENRLPRHPLVAKGYPSIGCAPCTSPVKEGEDPRAGRWRDQNKEECGIHVVDGKFLRTGAKQQ